MSEMMAEPTTDTTDEEQPWFIRIKDAARLVAIDDSTIRQAIYRKELHARKFQRRGWLIERQELRRWVMAVSTPNVDAPTTIPAFVVPESMSDMAPLMNILHREDQAMRPEDI